ncbi:glycoprotein hormone alpha subunit isoform X2 [Aplysia californica]|nr:glycoprotein hormone alpha subunit [Aplysia californica]XP_035826288.1 glycoprotein hormone alpha subunit isoform X2 [Aplysia californica]XP_035826289.1 glycoprotein hormone alpha subunit isoform X2 [Aplysia californica]ACN32202.1 glycoprotein hormone alpha subunit [Aplysia californica]CAR94693.2 TPA: putative glycoprotein hormone-alpha2 precursor [Aplysia californica]
MTSSWPAPTGHNSASDISSPRSSFGNCRRYLLALSIVVLFCPSVTPQRHSWEAPGCHLVGHTRTVSIPGCVSFEVTTNACRGFCVSYAIPSPSHTLAVNRNFVITSRAECCGIVDTHDVKVWVACRSGFQQKTFKSARSCQCSICRRSQ